MQSRYSWALALLCLLAAPLRAQLPTIPGVLCGGPGFDNHVSSDSSGGLNGPTTFGSSDASILNPNQPTCDFDFGSLLFGPPTGSGQQTTVAIDSVNGSDSNPGTLASPKQSLQQPAPTGSVFGLFRNSLFRDSLPFSSLGNTHNLLVEDVARSPWQPLPIISALDPVTNQSFVANGDGTYSYTWTGEISLANDGYSNVYVVEINTATEGSLPVASRHRMQDASASDIPNLPGSVLVQQQSGSTYTARLHPTDGLAPGSGSYRYEVVARWQPANWGAPNNLGDGAMSGVELVGSSSGYGSLGGPTSFTGDRLAFLHCSTHGAVIGGGSLARSIFYEMGDVQAIQIAWYAADASGLSWSMSDCLFYADVGNRIPYSVISHTSNGSNFIRGDISSCAFIGGRWTDASLRGVAIDYVNVTGGTIGGTYVQGYADAFGNGMPAPVEIKNSVFRQVCHTMIGSNAFHDNLVAAESGSNPADVNYRAPIGFTFRNAGAVITNNLFWAHGLTTALPSDAQASGFGFYPGVTTGTATHNIIVVDPATATTPCIYTTLPSPTTGVALDYNLVIFTGTFYVSGAANYTSWAQYQTANPTLDPHSLFVDLSTDPRGLNAVFANAANGDFRWAQTDVGSQCAAYCQANNVGPSTVTTHWPTVPTVDAAVAAISLLPPDLTSPGAVSFTTGAYGEYQITTNLDSTPGAPTSYSAAGLPTWLSVNTSSGVLSGTPFQAGNFSMTVSATNMAGTGSAVLGITVQTAYMAWQNTYFTAAELNNPAISGPDATPAGDGIPNLMKYALGLNPKIDGTGALPTISFTAVGSSSFLTLVYNRSLAANDVTYTVEVSGDLQTWSSGASYTATVITTNNAGNTMQTVVQRDLTPTSSAGRRFIRLKISQP